MQVPSTDITRTVVDNKKFEKLDRYPVRLFFFFINTFAYYYCRLFSCLRESIICARLWITRDVKFQILNYRRLTAFFFNRKRTILNLTYRIRDVFDNYNYSRRTLPNDIIVPKFTRDNLRHFSMKSKSLFQNQWLNL